MQCYLLMHTDALQLSGSIGSKLIVVVIVAGFTLVGVPARA